MAIRARLWAVMAMLAPAAFAGDKASGDLKYQAADYDGAVKDYEEALAGLGTDANSDAAAELWLAVGRALYSKGDYARAQAADEQALGISSRLYGYEHFTVARALSAIGSAV